MIKYAELIVSVLLLLISVLIIFFTPLNIMGFILRETA